MTTRREQIIEMLVSGPCSLHHIANFFRIDMVELLEDMEHIKYSVKPKKLRRIPSECKSCGFVFEERAKIRKPSKCPKCRSEWISEALFYVK